MAVPRTFGRWLAAIAVALVAVSAAPAATATASGRTPAAVPPMDTLLLDQVGFGFVRMSSAEEESGRQAFVAGFTRASPVAKDVLQDETVHAFENRTTGQVVMAMSVTFTSADLTGDVASGILQVGTPFHASVEGAGGVEATITNGGLRQTFDMVAFCRGALCFLTESVPGGGAARQALADDVSVAQDNRLRSYGITPETPTGDPTSAGATPGSTPDTLPDSVPKLVTPVVPSAHSSHRSAADQVGTIVGVSLIPIGIAIVVIVLVTRDRRRKQAALQASGAFGPSPPGHTWGPPVVAGQFDPTRPQPGVAWPAPPPPSPPVAPVAQTAPVAAPAPVAPVAPVVAAAPSRWPEPVAPDRTDLVEPHTSVPHMPTTWQQPTPAYPMPLPAEAPDLPASVASDAGTSSGSDTDPWIGTGEAAALLGVTPGVVRRMISAGTLPATRDGREFRVQRGAVLARRR